MLFGFSTKVQLDGRKQGICRKIKGGTQMPKAQNLCSLQAVPVRLSEWGGEAGRKACRRILLERCITLFKKFV